MAAPEKSPERFGGGVLVATLIVGLIAGFAAGYMARPRALQSAPPQEMASAPGTDAAVAPVPEAPTPAPAPARAPAPKAQALAPAPTPAPRAPSAPLAPITGSLLVRSSPSGATVSVDGVPRGVTPLALRDVALGSRNVVVARRGYIVEDRRVVLTGARPSRSLEVRLIADTANSAARPGTSASAAAARSSEVSPKLARSRASEGGSASTGALAVESRPPGAAVTINGRPTGTTPLNLDALEPGEYRVAMALPGYQPFATTVRVVAGARARAAASLSVLERE